ncbi:MAG: endonuclease Q family protein [Armatimonadota bacterium]|nr:endonuclease Q family protein [Armatimonadota bacterium]
MLYVCDLHVHIGRSTSGRPVKVTAARDLTFENIAIECARRKGVDVVGVVDCASPPVLEDIHALVDAGEMIQQPGGGLRYLDQVTVLLAAEFETYEEGGGQSHHVSYFPSVDALQGFSDEMAQHVTNLELSSQACRMPAAELLAIAKQFDAIFVPAHCFTPHRSPYGACAERLSEMFGEAWEHIPAIELGLSADSFLADRIGELADRSFLSNSDAHSLPKIGREYNIIEMAEPTFEELRMALLREGGRKVVANFGLDPRLGKYHRTFCEDCERIAEGEPPVLVCGACGSQDVTRGVLDRIVQIADYESSQSPEHRPPYQYQVPLEFVPGVGTVTLNRLINRFGSEMAVLHEATRVELGQTVGQKIAALIVQAREGTLPLRAGGGGHYGKAAPEDPGQLDLPGIG